MTPTTKGNECPSCNVNGDIIEDQLTMTLLCINQNCRVRHYLKEVFVTD